MKRGDFCKRGWGTQRRNVLRVTGGTVIALILGFTAKGQAPAPDKNPLSGTPQALKQALEREGFIVQKGKFKVVDLFGMYDLWTSRHFWHSGRM